MARASVSTSFLSCASCRLWECCSPPVSRTREQLRCSGCYLAAVALRGQCREACWQQSHRRWSVAAAEREWVAWGAL
eukprot:5360733-Pleurochrysis_carterae.AAC.1